ncbi:MAG: membrane protein insertase YidC [bacterium]|nr:membrane protein insertase YidC [bacterium]MDD5756572.1 membrane protein insertase YidC [bacterium]
MEKRVLIATFLSMMIIFLFWQAFQKPPTANNQPNSVKPMETVKIPASSTLANTAHENPAVAEPTRQAGQRISIQTNTSKISIGTKGGGIAAWQIKDKNGTWVDIAPTTAETQHLLTLDTKQAPYLAAVLFTSDKKDIVLHDSEQANITLTGKTPEGLEIIRTYSFTGEGYLVKTSGIFKNTSNAPLTVPDFNLWWGPGLNPLNIKANQNTANAWIDGKIIRKMKPELKTGAIRWAALDNQYFIVALLPQQAPFTGVISERNSAKQISVGLTSQAGLLSPGETSQYQLDVYAGPKEYHTLKTLGPKLEEMVGFGYLGKFVYVILEAINKVVQNYGWAIIILTLMMQAVLLPLTLKSYKSMKEMQDLQPLMKQLQEKYKTEPQRLNVEVMNLYKTHKVNPFGGCLPMLLQLPIFFALFNTIKNAVELRNAPFIFWIKDLSLPDTVFALAGVNINILPLLMGIGMFVQQKMTATDPQQAKMMMFMPVIFTVMFWGFPSGLVLYWFVNSLVSMIGQYVIMHKKPPKVEVVS